MATVNKDFKIKSGLVVEGTTGTINGSDILTKKQADQDYIVGLIGGTATAVNTPDTVVKRDGSGAFAAGQVTVTDLNIGTIGHIWDDGDLMISNIDGNDVILQGEDIRLNAQDDVRLNAGTGGDVFIQATSGNINLQGPNVYVGENIGYTDAERVASQGYVDDSIANIDLTFNTDEISEGATNLYFTNQRAIDAGDGVFDGFGAATTAENNAKSYADSLINDGQTTSTNNWSAYKTSTEIGLAQAAAELHADNAVAALVGSAPELLDTLQELAAAMDNDPEAINSLQSLAAGKQDALTAGNGIDIASNTVSVDPTDLVDNTGGPSTAYISASVENGKIVVWDNYITDRIAGVGTKSQKTSGLYHLDIDRAVVDGWYDASGAAATAEQNAKDYADALDTDDVAEGVAQYFTDARAKDSAGDLLAGATKSNIDITYVDGVLSVTAENGVAGSTTDDLTEGETNLYFQDERAFDAVSNTNIRFETVEITWVRREEATWTNVATASQVVCHQAGSNIGSMKYLVRTTSMVGGTRHSHVTELLATVDGGNGVAVVEYGTIYTSENPLATATILWNGLTNCYELNVTTANNNSEVMVAATLMAAVD